MFKRSSNYYKFEKNNKFADRVLVLSLPSAMVFIMLVALRLLAPSMAVISYATIILFNVVFLLPITFELQQLKNYVKNVSRGEVPGEGSIELSEKDAKEIVEAVNAMHRFWAAKTDTLEAQTISDTAVLDTLPDPIMMIDRAGNVIGANLSSRTLFGKEITDKNIEKVIDSNNFIEAVSRVLKKESESENLIFYVKKPIDQKLYAHIKQLPYLSKGRAVAVISLYDLTKAMKIEKMQSDFVANASHELRTPLTALKVQLEVLELSLDDKPARTEALKKLEGGIERASRLVEQLLALSKIDTASAAKLNEREIISWRQIWMQLKDDYRSEAEAKGIEIIEEFSGNGPIGEGNPVLCALLLRNLLDNAIKYSPNKAVIRAEIAEGSLKVINSDSCVDEKSLAKLGQRFYRPAGQKVPGSGLGLSIVKKIAEFYGCSVSFGNTENGFEAEVKA